MDVYSIINSIKPEELPSPPPVNDHAGLVVFTALKGYPELAADHLLNPQIKGKLVEVLGSITRQLNLEFVKSSNYVDEKERIKIRALAYNVLIEIALNLLGLERVWAGFSDDESEKALKIIKETVKSWEELERAKYEKPVIAHAVVKTKIKDMRKVLSSKPKREGMVAAIGQDVERKISENTPIEDFIEAMRVEIKNNIYYIMSKEGICRFGNDYAIGLRWLRRLGYVQVSTNPVLAAVAYDDDPDLWEKFKEYLRKHPELLENPDAKADELAMAATMVALWPNMEVFRPVAYLKNFTDGMISYQLNPNVADSVKGSLEDALKIYSATQEYFSKYDEYLLWGWPTYIERGRPNIVFKVAGSSPAAIDITRELETLGIGTNNTVTFTVAQEASLILAKMEGMAKAAKRGIRTTKVYETNMGGRLEDHLREVVAANYIRKALEKVDNKIRALANLAEKLGITVESLEGEWRGASGWGYDIVARTLEEKINLLASRQYIRPLNKEVFAEFLAEIGLFEAKDKALRELERKEKIIGYAGTLVAQRVWWIFFSPENRNKWIAYLVSRYNLDPEKAEEILNNIDVLPASKRKPSDTYLTLARNNMTNTEFPDHQLNVVKMSQEPGFKLSNYEDAIAIKHDPEILRELFKMEDFRKAYELTEDLARILSEVGIEVKDMGTNGLKPDEWATFGSTVKTMTGFTEGYNKFREKVVDVAKEVAKEIVKKAVSVS